MASQRAWNFYYRTLRRLVPDGEHQQDFYFRLLRNYVQPGITWLDAGCGHTLVPPWVKGCEELEEWFLGTAHEVVGCDADFASLSTHSRVRRVACNLEQSCFQQNVFDLVTCNLVAEHLERPARAFLEVFHALKPGGRFVVHTPNLLHWTTVASRFTPHWFHVLAVKYFEGREPDDIFPTRYRANTERALRRWLVAAGFTEVKIHFVPGLPHLVGLGPVLYLECLLHRVVHRFPQTAHTLCAVAQKPLCSKVS